MGRIGGTLFLKQDGQQLSTLGTFTYAPGDRERETIAGAGGVAGFKEMPVAPFMEAELATTEELSIQTLSNIVDTTLTVELANGFTYVLMNAWVVGRPEANAIDGSVSVRFEAEKIEEIAPPTS